jgi:hypothetical protein
LFTDGKVVVGCLDAGLDVMDGGHGLTAEGFGGDDGGSVVCGYCYRVEDKINVVLNNALTQKVCTTKHLNATLCTLGKLSC